MRFFKYLGLATILLFSFYYTEKINSIVNNNNSLMIEINNEKDKYNILPVNAEIDGEYIIPGINGYSVNVLKSYDNMRHLNTFNSYYLEYDLIKPNIGLNENKDKIIAKGNKKKKSVALIIYNNEEALEFFLNKNISFSKLINNDSFKENSSYEQINYDQIYYQDLEKKLNKYNINKKLCFILKESDNFCNNNNYIIKPTKVLSNYNLSEIKSHINSGDIIYINDNVKLSDLKILVRQIYYQDLKIVFLSDLINESY